MQQWGTCFKEGQRYSAEAVETWSFLCVQNGILLFSQLCLGDLDLKRQSLAPKAYHVFLWPTTVKTQSNDHGLDPILFKALTA